MAGYIGIIVGAIIVIGAAFLAEKASDKWKPVSWTVFVFWVCILVFLQIMDKKDSNNLAENQRESIEGLNLHVEDLSAQLTTAETQRQVDTAILKTKLDTMRLRLSARASSFVLPRLRSGLHGVPTHTIASGMSLTTLLRAPTTAPSPMLTPGPTKTSPPTQT